MPTNTAEPTTEMVLDSPIDESELPSSWPAKVKSAILHVISLAQFSLGFARKSALGAGGGREVRHDQLKQEINLRLEEIRIKDARMARLAPHERPNYTPAERLAILELKAARGWSLAQTARVFQVTPATIASWIKRVDENGPDALLQTTEPVNKYPGFVRYMVQRLQTLCPHMGKVKIAQILTRAGLHLCPTTVGRIRREAPVPEPTPDPAPDATPAEPPADQPATQQATAQPAPRRIVSKYPNHIWLVDLTTIPLLGGMWAPWLPFALPQCFPFCWWICCAMDHYSRRVVGFRVFWKQPTAAQVKHFLGSVIRAVSAAPKYLITDQGVQFTAATFRDWCQRRGIHQRFGALGEHGSIAVIERFWLTLKQSLACLPVISMNRRSFMKDLATTILWYNDYRPHMTLQGATPNEVYYRRPRANCQPRFEPRPNWPRGSPCASPQAPVDGTVGAKLSMTVEYCGVGGQRGTEKTALFQPPLPKPDVRLSAHPAFQWIR